MDGGCRAIGAIECKCLRQRPYDWWNGYPWAGLIASCGSFYPMVFNLTEISSEKHKTKIRRKRTTTLQKIPEIKDNDDKS